MSTMTRVDQKNLKRKGYKDGRPRYSKGTFGVYDSAYQKQKNLSEILPESNKRTPMSDHGLGDCRASLAKLEGNSDGYYKQDGIGYKSLIPVAKE